MVQKPTRNVRIEALRLAAIVAIAVFHAFQPVFAQAMAWMAAGDAAAALAAARGGDIGAIMASCPVASGALGFINLLGAYGNCVFFMISGFFLLPGCARASRGDGYWGAQLRKAGRRAAVIGISVALYAALALAVSYLVTPMPGISVRETTWLLGGLEFIWVYLAVMVVTPIMGWMWERCPRRDLVACLIIAAVYLVNAYIAFVSPGGAVRGLLEWRKLMSAVSYVAAYACGGLIGEARAAAERPHISWTAVLVCACVAVACLEEGLACAGAANLIVALSFKSTSALSFALAALSLLAAAFPKRPQHELDASPRRHALIRGAASGILGFYILQSMFYTVWRGAIDGLFAHIATGAAAGESLAIAAGLLLGAGVIASLIVIVVLLAFDALTRRKLLGALHLG